MCASSLSPYKRSPSPSSEPEISSSQKTVATQPLSQSSISECSTSTSLPSQVKELNESEAISLFENLKLPGLKKDTIAPTAEDFKNLSLIPKFAQRFDSSCIYFTSPFEFENRRWIFFIHEDKRGEKTARLAYLSNSQGLWRVFYGLVFNQIQKGIKEIDTHLPIKLNASFHQLFSHTISVLSELRNITLSDWLFECFQENQNYLRDTKSYQNYFSPIPLLKTVEGEPQKQVLASLQHTKWMNPSTMEIELKDNQPDFSKCEKTFYFHHPMFDKALVKASIFPSENGNLLYLFYEIENYGVYLASVEFQKDPRSEEATPITFYGNRALFPDCENLIEPIFQYPALIPRTHQPKDHVYLGGTYLDNRSYVNLIPLIRAYKTHFSLE